jgi:hypothetical protein
MNRPDAFALVCQYTQSDSLRRHMLAIEAAMRAYTRKFGEDEVRPGGGTRILERYGLATLTISAWFWLGLAPPVPRP